jgi:Barstar (barnase inhibitor)
MAVFEHDADLGQDVAFRLMANSFVTLFWRPAILDETTDWLRAHGYQVVRLDASAWTTEADLHRDVAAALEFPDYYGRNLDALSDCLRDVVSYDYGTSPQATGLVIVFTGYDRFAAHCPYAAQVVLDLFADQARGAALIGHRMMCLVQSDDPGVEFEPVGAMPVIWNEAEWPAAKRRPDDRA